jgi:hypothetical protein
MKTKGFISKYGTTGNSFTSAQPRYKRPATIGGGSAMNDGSTGQAEQQISAAPLPFQNPRAAANLPAPVNRNVTNPQGLPSARGTRPGNYAAAAPQSDPMAHSSMMKFSGYPPNYAPQQGHSPVISGRLKPGRTRIMRGAVPGSKPFVKPMSNDDFMEGVALYKKEHGKL